MQTDEETFYGCVNLILDYHRRQCVEMHTKEGTYKASFAKAEAAREILRDFKLLLPDGEARNRFIKELEQKKDSLFQGMFFDRRVSTEWGN